MKGIMRSDIKAEAKGSGIRTLSCRWKRGV